MKEARLLEAIGGVDPALVADAMPQSRPNPWRKWVTSAACVTLACLLGTAAWLAGGRILTELDKKHDVEEPWAVATTEYISTRTALDTKRIYLWEERSNPDRFYTAVIGGVEYTWLGREDGREAIGEKLGEVSLEGFDEYAVYIDGEDDGIRTGEADYYAVQGFDSAHIVALHFAGEEVYYVYIRQGAQAATLGELLDLIDLKANGSFGDCTVIDYEVPVDGYLVTTYLDPDDAPVWELLLSDRTLPVREDIAIWTFDDVMKIQIRIPALGVDYLHIQLKEGGYMVVSLPGLSGVFEVGEERVAQFVSAIEQSCPERNLTVYLYPKSDVPSGGGVSPEATTMWSAASPTTAELP